MIKGFLDDINVATTIVVAIVGAIVMGLRKILTEWSVGRTAAAKADAETDIVEQLRVEVRRLADQNDKLAKTVNDLQLQLIEVGKENAELKAMLDRLTAESRH